MFWSNVISFWIKSAKYELIIFDLVQAALDRFGADGGW